ncbi:MAG TPA: hypothetical protein VG755_46045 [Nannocystaceae bacterium]|nr:hypothetical protein [Nannocystaceae bacterium]
MDNVGAGWGVRWVACVSLVVVGFVAGGSACTVIDDSDGDTEGGCFIGEECPDGSCALGIPIPAQYPCCGFGGECPPSSGTQTTSTPDDTSTSESSTTEETTSTTEETTRTTEETTTEGTSTETTTESTGTDTSTSTT